MFSFSDLVQCLHVDERPNHIEKAVYIITAFVWTGPHSVLSDRWCFCGVLSWKRSSSFWPCSLETQSWTVRCHLHASDLCFL